MIIIPVQELQYELLRIRIIITIHHPTIITQQLPDLNLHPLLQEVILVIAQPEATAVTAHQIAEAITPVAIAAVVVEDHPVEDDKINTNQFTYVLTKVF
jgi:uncharacterized protein (DUF1501 family)